MLIDVDIKITDYDGNLLHCYEKQLDEVTDYTKKLSNKYFGEDFGDFLSEYMSFSGLMMREQLTADYFTASNRSDKDDSSGERSLIHNAPYDRNDREIEIKLRIGNKNIFVAKIPMKQLLLADESDNIYMKLERKKDPQASNLLACKKRRKLKNSSPSVKQDKASMGYEKDAVLDILLNYAMVKAIEKYESNLYPARYDDVPDVIEEESVKVIECS